MDNQKNLFKELEGYCKKIQEESEAIQKICEKMATDIIGGKEEDD